MVTLERCPDGMLGECLYQKEAPESLPGATPTKLIHHVNRDLQYVVGGSLETQLASVNLGCVPCMFGKAGRPMSASLIGSCSS